jgi:hypothetical protein
MVTVAIGVLIFFSGSAAWAGAKLAFKPGSALTRFTGAALLVAGISGVLYGVRLLGS